MIGSFDHFSKSPRTAEFFSGGRGVTSDAFGNVIFVTKCLALSRVLILFDVSNCTITICKRMKQKQSLLTVKNNDYRSYQ